MAGSRWRVHGALVLVQLAFAGFHVVAKATLAHFTPQALVALRVFAATPLLLALAWAVDRRLPSRRDLPWLALLGLLGVFGNQLLFMTGLRLTTASSAAVLMPSIPVFAAGLAFALRIERPSLPRVAGIVLAVAGAVVMIGPASGGRLVGNLLVLANCLSFAAFLVVMRRVVERLPVFTVTAWAFVFGGAGLVAVGARDLAEIGSVPAAAWGGLAYIVLLPTVFAYVANTWAVARSSPTLVAAYITLQPLAAAVLAATLLGESPGLGHLVGGLLIVAGLFAVSRANPPKPKGSAKGVRSSSFTIKEDREEDLRAPGKTCLE